MFDLHPSTIFWNTCLILLILLTYFIFPLILFCGIFIILNIVAIFNCFYLEYYEGTPIKSLWMIISPVFWVVVFFALLSATYDYLIHDDESPINRFNNWINLKFNKNKND